MIMNIVVRLGLIGVILAGALAVAGMALPGTTGGEVNRTGIDRAIDAAYASSSSGILGMCVGVVDAQYGVIRCYGHTRRGGTRRPDKDTLFKIGSITKTFTATLLSLRVHEGKVKLSTPARAFVPVRDGGLSIPKTMTLLDLADHYSGLPRDLAPSATVSSAATLFADVARCERTANCPNDKPGRSFHYSNYAFSLLGAVLGAADRVPVPPAGYSPWEVSTDVDILAPLGMYATASPTYWENDFPDRFAKLRAYGEEAGATVTSPYNGSPPWTDPGGALYSSSSDMLKWLRFSMGRTGPQRLKAVVPLLYDAPASVRPRGTNPDKAIGLSWNVDSDHGTTCVWKSGSVAGFTSFIEFVKGQRFGVFVLLNNRKAADPAQIGFQIMNTLPPSSTRCAAHGIE
jgi:D-alanyl-D-alanine-carboxypeptidase/D-alanyl-D-alanine-endopeptidase